MNKTITLEIPEEIERDARAVAQQSGVRVEEVLTNWLERFASEMSLDSMPDDRILELSDMQMPVEQQDELSDLLEQNREATLDEQGRIRLDELMQIYRRGLVRKAEALKIAVQRGLKAPLS